jgi:hypothetical protein
LGPGNHDVTGLHVGHLHGAFHNAAGILVDHFVFRRHTEYVHQVAGIARFAGKQLPYFVQPGLLARITA